MKFFFFSAGEIEASQIIDFVINNEDVFYLVEEHGIQIWVAASQLKAPINSMEQFFVQYLEKLKQKETKRSRK